MMKISLIAAIGRQGQIGLNGDIPFKSDLKRFKWLTLGKTVVMGRKTYESIGKPLPGRTTIVLTRNREWQKEGVFTVTSVQEAMDLANIFQRELMVCGGQDLYEQFYTFSDRIYLTEIDYIGKCDAVFPIKVVNKHKKNGRWRTIFQEGNFTILDKVL
jgi:dihydrofolate reductase